MPEKLRVHTLSKELNVKSKAILEKCKSEGVEGITNHMSTVSAGLAETIREWFSGEEQHRTAVETAERVDLEKVRAKRRARKKKEEAEAANAAAAEATTAVAEPEEQVAEDTTEEPAAEQTVVSEETAAPTEAEQTAETAAAEATTEQPAEQETEAPATASEEPVAAEPVEAAPPAEEPATEVEEEPVEQSEPAGPQNVPAPAQMKGPNIVGFAKPDVLRPPAPRGPRPSPRPVPPEEIAPGPTPAKKGKGKGGGPDDDSSKGRRRANPRRSGRSLQEVGERLREWNDRDWLERQERLQAAGRGIHARRAKEKSSGGGPQHHVAPRKTKAEITEPIIVHELAAATGIGMQQMWPKFKNEHNLMINRNTVIPTDLAQLVMLDFGVELTVVKPKTQLEQLQEEFAQIERKNLEPRPPVVTMLGHVDHGKTSLLDAIRATSVASGEAGGITQHIGAYQVERGDLKVTFLDTPGHEAFTAMRARGANMTDVVVLVIAADDGVMPQTVEAINHAKAAKVNIVVALNKSDIPGVDFNKVFGQLAEHELVPAEWGGETDVIRTSATTGEGVEELITHLSTLSELMELKADPTLPATGAVVEAEMQQGAGPVARVLVRQGTLKQGDFVVAGVGAGRVRSLRDDRGRTVDKAGPGTPVELLGLDEVPGAGDPFFVVSQLQRAKDIAEELREQHRAETLTRFSKAKSLEDIFAQRQQGELAELNMILRADVSGSIDAILKSLQEIPDDEVKLNILHTGIGSVTEGDVVLAEASDAVVVGFNVTAETGAQRQAEAYGVDIRTYQVIYNVIDDIRKALEGLLEPDRAEETRGKAEVREVFQVSKAGSVAGCFVTEGTITRSHFLRVIRDGQIIVPTADDAKRRRHRAVASLRRFKDDAKEVRSGMECGIRVENFDDVKPGDILEAYEVIETARKLG